VQAHLMAFRQPAPGSRWPGRGAPPPPPPRGPFPGRAVRPAASTSRAHRPRRASGYSVL